MVQDNGSGPLEESIGYRFTDRGLLERALTRLAYSHEQQLPAGAHMDALAVLGDAVIELVAIQVVIASGEYDKGVITTRKMDLVNMSVLRRTAESIGLMQYIRWGKGEAEQHIWTSGRVLAECFEALAGAVFLDGGVIAATQMMRHTGLI
jgi:ribonuclease-3